MAQQNPSTRPLGMASARALARDLRSPRFGLIGELARFGLAGGLVTLFYIGLTTVLYKVADLPFQAALAIGFVAALMLHFTLQRIFVWIHYAGFTLTLKRQIRRYLGMAVTQYALTAVATSVLPRALGIPTEIVYLATMAVVTTAGFLIMRFLIFHGADEPGATEPSSARCSGRSDHLDPVQRV
jgi:putative flippase GtrA